MTTETTPEQRVMLSSALNGMVGYVQSAKMLKGVRQEWIEGLEARARNLQEAMKEILDVE